MYKYEWQLTPPEEDQARANEFWFRRVWLAMKEGLEPAQLLDVYQVVISADNGEVMLHGCGETIEISQIESGDFIEWSPIPEPTANTLCKDYVVLKEE
jgi:hypothetical protein